MGTFVYGTLMYPEVLRALINRVPPHQPASIAGYSRWRIKNQVFPGIIKHEDGGDAATPQVQGLLFSDLTPLELAIFDDFEGEEYVKTAVTAQLLASGQAVPASVYVWKEHLRGELFDAGGWDPEEFRRLHLGPYAEMCGRFAAELAAERKWDWKQETGTSGA